MVRWLWRKKWLERYSASPSRMSVGSSKTCPTMTASGSRFHCAGQCVAVSTPLLAGELATGSVKTHGPLQTHSPLRQLPGGWPTSQHGPTSTGTGPSRTRLSACVTSRCPAPEMSLSRGFPRPRNGLRHASPRLVTLNWPSFAQCTTGRIYRFIVWFRASRLSTFTTAPRSACSATSAEAAPACSHLPSRKSRCSRRGCSKDSW